MEKEIATEEVYKIVETSSLSRVISNESLIYHLTLGLKVDEIVTLKKGDITIYAVALKPHIGVTADNNYLARAILQLLRDGWTAIPF